MIKAVQVRELLFEFASHAQWVRTAPYLFRQHGHSSESTLCVDQNGLICARGKQFGEAVYPVMVFAIDDPPFEPTGMRGERKPVK